MKTLVWSMNNVLYIYIYPKDLVTGQTFSFLQNSRDLELELLIFNRPF